MNTDLMQINLNVQHMSSREIAERTGKAHSNVLRDIRTMLEQIDNSNMNYQQYQVVTDEQTKRTAEILLDKELTLTLVAGYNANLRHVIIKRWQELEAKAKEEEVIAKKKEAVAALPDFTNPAIAARAWADEVEAKMIALEQVAELEPKAAALDVLSHVKGAVGIRAAAKALGIPERQFIARCMDENKPVSSRFLYRDNHGKLNAYAHRIKQGFMTQKITSYQGKNGLDFASIEVKFTPKGLAHIAELMQVAPIAIEHSKLRLVN